jgi:hydroxymethylglutaryl-CoA lyase
VNLPERVTLVEVGARDGLQNEPAPVSVGVRVELIERLAAAGLPAVEAGAFVSPRRVPQMADTAAVLARLTRRPGVRYPVLVPNLRGLDEALAAGADEVAVFGAASETFSRRNIECSIAESLERFAPVVAGAAARGVRARGYVSCALGCPFEGRVPPGRVAEVAAALWDLGCHEISLGDTIGVGTPGAARTMVEAVAERVPMERVAAHFHDTYGHALANLLAVMDVGVAVIDASVAGLGGCPYAPGATGNVATEDVLYMLDGLGVRTGVSPEAVLDAARFISVELGRAPASRVAAARTAR